MPDATKPRWGLYGRKPATHPVGYRLLDHYVDAIPEAPPTFDHTNGYDNFLMWGNGPDNSLHANGGNPVGDCAFVGTVVVNLVDEIETHEPAPLPTSDEVVNHYLAYNHGQDVGCNLSELLSYWHTVGLPWSGKIAGYAGLNFRDLDTFWAGVNAFGNGYLGIVVTEAMEQQSNAGEPWDLTGTDADNNVLGGHCVTALARTSAAGDGVVETWAMRQPFTARWFQHNVEEAHVVLTHSQVARKGNGYGLNIAKLESDLNQLSL